MSLDAGDDAGVAGDFTVPTARVGIITEHGLVGELLLQLRYEICCGGVVVALFADVGVGQASAARCRKQYPCATRVLIISCRLP